MFRKECLERFASREQFEECIQRVLAWVCWEFRGCVALSAFQATGYRLGACWELHGFDLQSEPTLIQAAERFSEEAWIGVGEL